MNTCQNCKYWDENKAVGYTSTEGKCRVDPPAWVARDQIIDLTGYWPSTQVDDWCGKHEPNAEKSEMKQYQARQHALRTKLDKPKESFIDSQFASQQAIEALMIDLVRKHGIASNAMTEQQIADALRQAIACGDFTRHVSSTSDAQCVVYLPFTREAELLSEISKLKKFIEANGMKIPTSCCESC